MKNFLCTVTREDGQEVNIYFEKAGDWHSKSTWYVNGIDFGSVQAAIAYAKKIPEDAPVLQSDRA